MRPPTSCGIHAEHWRHSSPKRDRPHDSARAGRAAERFCAGFGVATRFQVSPGARPADLDATLAVRGYRWDSPMSLQTASTVYVQAQAGPDGSSIRLNETPTTAWFEVWYAVHGHGSDPQIEWEMLGRVTQPSAYAGALEGDEVIAVGRAVADASWAGVFGSPASRASSSAR